MKYLSAVLPLMMLGTLSLSACTKQETKTTSTTQTTASQSTTATTAPAGGGTCMDKIRKDGLRVITSPDYPPYESTNEQNQIVGFDVDLVNALAKEIGIEAKFTGQGFDGLIPSLIANRADLIAAGLTKTEERAKSVSFSDPYEETKNVIVVSAKDTGINGPDTLKGKTVGVQLGTVQADMAAKIDGADVRTFNLFSEALAALKAGQIDSMIVDAPAGDNYVKANKDVKLAGQMDGGNKALATRLECTDLVAELNAALATVQQNGQMKQIHDKWFNTQAK
ncbi:basic amino acid ABC transporter substrate-binding protein [Deinococcus sp. Marseille-Q6407]|uniref:basic amino acid ABC transporter substrate-binding protein n=1 Tax=Deinococcus sp. Marseille-Q6407 TaxID=2969223 RepID=UPI0021BED94C|nr:basic amino acid ABC transporter substrate-binding protein [Deinococcus sp. Marseille-Q6407]